MPRPLIAQDAALQTSPIERLHELRSRLARQLAGFRRTDDIRGELDLAAALELEAHGIPATLPSVAPAMDGRRAPVGTDGIRAEIARAESLELAAHGMPLGARRVA